MNWPMKADRYLAVAPKFGLLKTVRRLDSSSQGADRNPGVREKYGQRRAAAWVLGMRKGAPGVS